jgi:ATP-dependent RNA helicase HelY
MAVNLIEAFGRSRARQVLETSFAQFQADRSVVGMARGIRDKQISLDGYAKSMECHLGDFFQYSSIRRELTDIEKVLAAGNTRSERGKDIRQTKGRSEAERKLAELKVRMKTHPCHSCKDRETHARWAERWWKMQRETKATLDQIEGRTNQVASTFDKICELLIELGYLNDSDQELTVTDSGKMLARIYGERDLLVSEAIRLGTWDALDPAGLAAMAASLVYELRRDDEGFEPRIPKGSFQDAILQTQQLWEDLEQLSKKHKLPRAATGALSVNAKDAIDKVRRGIVAYSYYA